MSEQQRDDTQGQSGQSQSGQPEYGAMAGQYPGYDPYLYGKPEPEQPTQPEQNQPGQPVAGAGMPVGGQVPSAAQPAQPVQPQPLQPQPGFNPYPYGAPEPEQPTQPQPGNAYPQPGNGYPGNYGQPGPQQFGPQQLAPQQPGYGGYGNGHGQFPGQAPAADGHMPRYKFGIDVNDPRQNPLYGRWDLYAVLSFVFAVIFPLPVVPALMGALAMWRTRTFHMKGFPLALAAVIINVLFTIGYVWLIVNGLPTDMTQLLGNLSGGGSGGNGGGDGSVAV